MTADELARIVGKEASRELDSAVEKIKHCLAQLDDQQIWSRPQPALNSIGNLLLHLEGNLRQWIVAGIGGAKDVRDRPAEFARRDPISKAEVMHRLDAVVAEAKVALAGSTADGLVKSRRIQGSDTTGLAAVFSSIPHFRGHTQEIIHMTRSLLKDAYKLHWKPLTPEQGAPH